MQEKQIRDKNMNARRGRSFGVDNWTMENSVGPHNIIWTNFNQKTPFDMFNDGLANVFLFFLTIAMSPVAWG